MATLISSMQSLVLFTLHSAWKVAHREAKHPNLLILSGHFDVELPVVVELFMNLKNHSNRTLFLKLK